MTSIMVSCSHMVGGWRDVEVKESRVGLRELKAHLSGYVRRVKAGERIVVTERNRVVAALVPPGGEEELPELLRLAREGLVAWKGGKPTGLRPGPAVRGASVADAVVEERG
ncbi:MAG: type II toxin-antitoxin system prevent-host-death family antitoxin [Meiothermus silvanus]|nr:type II toxin-antitoxin system prevent-host-death family antitoxin [Allomeiothermus silvanus]